MPARCGKRRYTCFAGDVKCNRLVQDCIAATLSENERISCTMARNPGNMLLAVCSNHQTNKQTANISWLFAMVMEQLLTRKLPTQHYDDNPDFAGASKTEGRPNRHNLLRQDEIWNTVPPLQKSNQPPSATANGTCSQGSCSVPPGDDKFRKQKDPVLTMVGNQVVGLSSINHGHGWYGQEGERRWWLQRVYCHSSNHETVMTPLTVQGPPTRCRLVCPKGMSLQVDCGNTQVSDTIVWLYKGGITDDTLEPGDQHWCINESDGTISCCVDHHGEPSRPPGKSKTTAEPRSSRKRKREGNDRISSTMKDSVPSRSSADKNNTNQLVLGHGSRQHLAKICGGTDVLLPWEHSDGVLVLVQRDDPRALRLT